MILKTGLYRALRHSPVHYLVMLPKIVGDISLKIKENRRLFSFIILIPMQLPGPALSYSISFLYLNL